MKTIWNKLKPEYKQRILKHQEKYSVGPQRMEETLNSIIFWGELTVEELRDFFTWTNQCLTNMDWEDMFGDRFINKD